MSNLGITNGLGYTGKVTLKKYELKTKKVISETIIKNRGTTTLFRFLCQCLIQQYNGTNAPRYLGATIEQVKYSGTSVSQLDNTTLQSALTYRSKLSNTQLIENVVDATEANITGTNWHAIFNANIVYGQLNGAHTVIKSLQLYSTQSSSESLNPLAFINLGADGIQLKPGEALIVEWDMSFNNWQLQSNS